MKWLTVLALMLALAPAAAADPPLTQLEHAVSVARAYWHGNPPCGTPSVVSGPAEYWGEAFAPECRIELGGIDWVGKPADLCEVVTHEWGHLVLGPTYFASVNPTEPNHSPDPTNIMFGGGGRWSWQQEVAQRSVGCLPPLPIKAGFGMVEAKERAHAHIARHHRHWRRSYRPRV